MISELNDDDILDFLMTSEFEGDYSPTELKFLLVKWRLFYRVLYGNLERVKIDTLSEFESINGELDAKIQQNHMLMVRNADNENLINNLKNRKLTLKERLTGKIITKEEKSDEN